MVKRHLGQLRKLQQLTKPPRCVSCECDNPLSAYHQHQKHSFPFHSISIPKPSPIQQDLQTRYAVRRRRTAFDPSSPISIRSSHYTISRPVPHALTTCVRREMSTPHRPASGTARSGRETKIGIDCIVQVHCILLLIFHVGLFI
jgi:hypothetical protein